MHMRKNYFLLTVAIIIGGCTSLFAQQKNDSLPEPYATKSSMNFSNVTGWDNGALPVAPAGFTVTKFADGFDNPRWMYELPNGDLLVAESNSNYSAVKKVGAAIIGASKSDQMSKSADRITLIRPGTNGSAGERSVFLSGLNQPFGMLLLGKWLYVANTNGLYRYPYKTGIKEMKEKGTKILDLPAGKHNRHWCRNIIANEKGTKIYIAIGSGSNVAENGIANELLRADILEINPDGTNMRVYASGLRNPCGMGWAPGTNTLWTAVNERDELGDELVPDYLTSVKDGGFYGWPYSYYGQHIDPRVKENKPELVKKAIVPDVSLGAHTASLGLAFCTNTAFPARYRNGAFIAQHGSWNRSVLAGYKVVFVPFKDGKPTGGPQDFLTGFIDDLGKEKVHGRPVGIIFRADGTMLLTDDVNNTIWKITANK